MQKIKFTDPQTNDVVEFAVEEETTLNGTRYLLVSEGEESGDCEAYILKEVSTKDEEVLYQMVEDDVEFSAIAKDFLSLRMMTLHLNIRIAVVREINLEVIF